MLLGHVHRDVGSLEESLDVRAMIREESDADARLHLEGETVNREWLLEGRPQLARDRNGRLGVEHLREQHAELVPAEARDGVALAKGVAEPDADLLQQLVAARMPEGVVDLLEAVEVHDHHRGRDVVPARRCERRVDAVVEERPVRQVGQGVMERLVLVHLGLMAQGSRGTGDDPEHDPVEDGETHEDQHRVVVRPPANARLDLRVRDGDLDCACRMAARLEPQRHVDVEAGA